MKKPGKCVHYNGIMNDCCSAGVNYKELAGPGEAWGTRLPCYGPEYRLARGQSLPRADVVATCEKMQMPTPEEVEADEKRCQESFARIGKARYAIVAHLGGPWKKGMGGAAGVIVCPNCGGNLQFSRSSYNGHIHAQCSSKGCAAWME